MRQFARGTNRGFSGLQQGVKGPDINTVVPSVGGMDPDKDAAYNVPAPVIFGAPVGAGPTAPPPPAPAPVNVGPPTAGFYPGQQQYFGGKYWTWDGSKWM